MRVEGAANFKFKNVIFVVYYLAMTFILASLYVRVYVSAVERTHGAEIKLREERKALLYKYDWDGAGEEELLRRVMLYSGLSPEELSRYFSKQELGRVFLENIQSFNEEKRKLWMNYLNIPEEEVKRWERK